MTESEPEPDSKPALTQDDRSQTLSRRNWLTGLAAAPLVSGLPDLQASDDTPPGEQQWAFETGDLVLSSPVVVDETVYVGSHDTNLYAVDAATGDQEWAFETGGDVFSSPAVADGTVYVGSHDTNLYAVDAATGTQEWAFETGNNVQSSPAVANGTVYIGSEDTYLYAVDTATGAEEWAFEVGNPVNSSPTVADGTVYVGSYDDSLHAIGAKRAPRATATPTPTATRSPTPRATDTADGTEGSLPPAELLTGAGLVGLILTILLYMRREENDSVDPPAYYCGYVYLADFIIDTDTQPSTRKRHCCVRTPLPDAERCGIHASPADTESKQDAIQEIGSFESVLDGAILPGSVADEVDLTGVTHLRDVDLSGVSLNGSDFSSVNLWGTDLSGATLTATDVTAATLRETRVIDHHAEQTDATKQILHNLGAITDSS